MPNAETERNGHERGWCAARIGTDCSPPHIWHLATPPNERNNEFFLLKGFTSTYLKETRFSFHAHFSWGPPPLGVIPEKRPPLACRPQPSLARAPQTESMATGLARDEIANDSRTGAVGRERFANGRERARRGANGRVGARTGASGRERARRGANGASGRQLLLEVHESAALFTAGDLPFLK